MANKELSPLAQLLEARRDLKTERKEKVEELQAVRASRFKELRENLDQTFEEEMKSFDKKEKALVSQIEREKKKGIGATIRKYK